LLASDTLASLQDLDPHLRGQTPASWRLLRWHVQERILQALVGYFIFHNDPIMALSLLLGFYSMLRTGEVLSIRPRDVLIIADQTTAVVSLANEGWQTHPGRRRA
jgi:integrase